MKNTRLLFCMLVGLLVFSPVFVNALTEEEAIAKVEEKFNKVSTTNEDGTCTWNFKTIDTNTLFGNSCNLTKEQFLEAREWCDGVKCIELNDDELQVHMDSYKDYCKSNVFPALSSINCTEI